MNRIYYLYNGAQADIGWNEENEALVKREADNGEYTIKDDGIPEPVAEPTADDVLNAMLGVTRYE